MIEVKEPKKELPLVGTLKAMWIVGKHIFQKPVTTQYPEEKKPMPDRFRFRIFLSLDILHLSGISLRNSCRQYKFQS